MARPPVALSPVTVSQPKQGEQPEVEITTGSGRCFAVDLADGACAVGEDLRDHVVHVAVIEVHFQVGLVGELVGVHPALEVPGDTLDEGGVVPVLRLHAARFAADRCPGRAVPENELALDPLARCRRSRLGRWP